MCSLHGHSQAGVGLKSLDVDAHFWGGFDLPRDSHRIWREEIISTQAEDVGCWELSEEGRRVAKLSIAKLFYIQALLEEMEPPAL